MNYEVKNGKFIFNKGDAYFSLTIGQVRLMNTLTGEILEQVALIEKEDNSEFGELSK